MSRGGSITPITEKLNPPPPTVPWSRSNRVTFNYALKPAGPQNGQLAKVKGEYVNGFLASGCSFYPCLTV